MFVTLAKMCLLLLEVSVEYTNMNGLTKFLQILYGISVSDLPSAVSNDHTGHQHKPVLYLFLSWILLSFFYVQNKFSSSLAFRFLQFRHFFSDGDEMATAYIYIYVPIRRSDSLEYPMLIEGTWYGCSMWLLLVPEIHKQIFKTIYTRLQQKMSIKLSTRKSEKLINIFRQHLMTLN
jgi:hypothetical protein